jgi:ElaB/YqjD/DUF883 family membrane-anchored ribosome-binding protein
MNNEHTSENLTGAAKEVADDGLHTVKDAVNTAIESTHDIVQELQSGTMKAVNETVGRTIDRVTETLDEQRPRFEQYIASHPWIMLGGLVIIWYLLTGKRQSGA